MINDKSRLDWKAISVIVLTTLTFSVMNYHDIFRNIQVDRWVFYVGIPLVFILVVFREKPAQYGFTLGDWRLGLIYTLIAILGISVFMPLIVKIPGIREFYSVFPKQLAPLVLNSALEMFAWEFIFRGFLLFALVRIAGPYAILLQAVPFTLMHFAKPEVETLSCIFGGSAFGYLAWRTRSFFYPAVIHTYLMVLVVLLA